MNGKAASFAVPAARNTSATTTCKIQRSTRRLRTCPLPIEATLMTCLRGLVDDVRKLLLGLISLKTIYLDGIHRQRRWYSRAPRWRDLAGRLSKEARHPKQRFLFGRRADLS